MKKYFFLFVALMWTQSAWASFITGCEGVVKVVDVRQKTFLTQAYTLTVTVDAKKAPCFRGPTDWVFDISSTNVLQQRTLEKGSWIESHKVSVEPSAQLWQKDSKGQDVLDLKRGDLLYLKWEHIDGDCEDGVCYYDRIKIAKWNGKK